MAQRFDRVAYFNAVRASLFSGALSQEQVDGQNVLLGLWESEATGTPMTDIRWLAYILASVYHETAHKMWPLKEYGQGEGREYGEPDPETKQTYFGRGLIQITWRENYSKMSKLLSLVEDRDLEWHADVALDSLIAARITFRGMAEGIFTGKKLGDYFNEEKDDPVGARAIVNDADRDEEIAGYHAEFLNALNDGRYA
jgi:hypothetical protein